MKLVTDMNWKNKMSAELPNVADINEEIVGMVRSKAKAMGFNCTFVDDDLAIMASLAARAIDAGLTDHLSKDMQERLSNDTP